MGLAIFLALVCVPIVEILVFIEVGGRIGPWPTIGLVLLTAIVGTALLRAQGLAALASARATVDAGGFPVREALDGVCLLLAGALLLTPGFVTDALGGLLLVVPIRRALQYWALTRLKQRHRTRTGPGGERPGSGRSTVIEGEFTVVDEDGREEAKRTGPDRGPTDDARLPPSGGKPGGNNGSKE
jgi:UPF0716 protein FxsA